MVAGMDICDETGSIQVGVALEEALRNAIHHGNLELTDEQLALPEEELAKITDERSQSPPYSERKCMVRCMITRDEARLTIRDGGPGFDVQNKLNVSVNDESSRGLVLMWGLMDKVLFNKVGNEVSLIKRKHKTERPIEQPTQKHGEKAAKQEPEKLGELISVDGGPSIPLNQRRLSIGRHPSCDVVLSFSDVSQQHCLLYMYSGWWYVKDLKSANGIRINPHAGRSAPHFTRSDPEHRHASIRNPLQPQRFGRRRYHATCRSVLRSHPECRLANLFELKSHGPAILDVLNTIRDLDIRTGSLFLIWLCPP